MATYVAGIVFLVVCLFGIPILRRVLHERALRALGMEGVTVIPGFWRLGGLQLKRSRWEGRVLFESAGLGNNYRRGHVRFRAAVAPKTPPDPQLLRRLEECGGRVSALDGAAIEISGPLSSRTEELRSFLELSAAIVDGMV